MRWSAALSVWAATIAGRSGEGNARPKLMEMQPPRSVSATRDGSHHDRRMADYGTAGANSASYQPLPRVH